MSYQIKDPMLYGALKSDIFRDGLTELKRQLEEHILSEVVGVAEDGVWSDDGEYSGPGDNCLNDGAALSVVIFLLAQYRPC
jgi:hypothetical protein